MATRRARRLAADRRRSRRRSVLGWLLVGVLAFVFWPQQLGGDTAIVVVHGTSMTPTYHTGDVLLVRSVDSVAVGDIAVYRVPSGIGKGQHVVHRVIDVASDGRLQFQGDAKDRPDDFRPTMADVVGRPVVDLGPLPLRLVGALPLIAAVVIALTVGWMIWPDPVETTPTARFPDAVPAAIVLDEMDRLDEMDGVSA
ncbi:MAG: signal peptidase I [Acidimicrobiales bacterium]